jgi:hypothetical protein
MAKIKRKTSNKKRATKRKTSNKKRVTKRKTSNKKRVTKRKTSNKKRVIKRKTSNKKRVTKRKSSNKKRATKRKTLGKKLTINKKRSSQQTWNNILNRWENGEPLTYPLSVKEPFMWRTSPLDNSGTSVFKEEFTKSNVLPKEEDCEKFNEYFSQPGNIVVFTGHSGTRLVVPKPVAGKNYSHIKNFIDNAPHEIQVELWKTVARVAKEEANKHGKVWISTHGLGVPCLHVRINSHPQYYENSKLAKL